VGECDGFLTDHEALGDIIAGAFGVTKAPLSNARNVTMHWDGPE
jgi:hypothetical protein